MTERGRQGVDAGDLPNLCAATAYFSVVVATQAAVMVAALAAPVVWSLKDLALFSLYAQILALWCTATICGIRRGLGQLPVSAGAVALLVGTGVVGWVGAYSAMSVAELLDLGPRLSGSLTQIANHHAMIAVIIAALVLRYLYAADQWRRQAAAGAASRVRALQARIRPHFLFNSLNTIAGLVRRDPELAETTVEDLAELFRSTLADPDRDATLAEEIELCRRYLAIERLRLGTRLAVRWEIDSLPLQARLPSLLLQPLVENAIVHGISKIEDGGEIRICGEIDRASGDWWLEIANPYPKMAPGTGVRGGIGMALRNVSERLERRFGPAASLQTTVDERYVVRMSIPGLPSSFGEFAP